MRGALWLLALLALSAACDALYLPGVAPLDFARDDLVYFKARFPGSFTTCYAPAHATGQVNSLVSAKSALPIEYYSLPFCRCVQLLLSTAGASARILSTGSLTQPAGPDPPRL
jgi:hypothetical protein